MSKGEREHNWLFVCPNAKVTFKRFKSAAKYFNNLDVLYSRRIKGKGKTWTVLQKTADGHQRKQNVWSLVSRGSFESFSFY